MNKKLKIYNIIHVIVYIITYTFIIVSILKILDHFKVKEIIGILLFGILYFSSIILSIIILSPYVFKHISINKIYYTRGEPMIMSDIMIKKLGILFTIHIKVIQKNYNTQETLDECDIYITYFKYLKLIGFRNIRNFFGEDLSLFFCKLGEEKIGLNIANNKEIREKLKISKLKSILE